MVGAWQPIFAPPLAHTNKEMRKREKVSAADQRLISHIEQFSGNFCGSRVLYLCLIESLSVMYFSHCGIGVFEMYFLFFLDVNHPLRPILIKGFLMRYKQYRPSKI